MTNHSIQSSRQQGFMLLEGLIAILIFAFGILGIVAMGARAVSAQSDAQYRTEAANMADQIAGTISVSVDRTTPISTQLVPFAYSGSTSSPVVQNWLDKVVGNPTATNDPAISPGLPGATTAMQTIAISGDDVNGHLVSVTVRWKAPTDLVARSHTLLTYVLK